MCCVRLSHPRWYILPEHVAGITAVLCEHLDAPVSTLEWSVSGALALPAWSTRALSACEACVTIRPSIKHSGQICTQMVPGDHSGSPDCQDDAVVCVGELRWSDRTHSLAYERPGWSTSVVLLTHGERARTC